MSRRRAWILAAIASASLVALIIGVGAATGEFGFGGGQQGAQAEGAPPTSEKQPLRASLIADTQQQQQSDVRAGDESENDDKYEHQQGDHHDERDGTSNDTEADD